MWRPRCFSAGTYRGGVCPRAKEATEEISTLLEKRNPKPPRLDGEAQHRAPAFLLGWLPHIAHACLLTAPQSPHAWPCREIAGCWEGPQGSPDILFYGRVPPLSTRRPK